MNKNRENQSATYFEDIETIGRKIRERRKRLGLSQRELVERIDETNPTLSRIENGEGNPRYSTLRNIWNELSRIEGKTIGEGEIVKRLMVTEITDVGVNATKEEAREIMRENNFSQLPVIDEDGEYVGVITEDDMMQVEDDSTKVADFHTQNFKVVEPSDAKETVKSLLNDCATVLVKEDGEYVGIVNKADVM